MTLNISSWKRQLPHRKMAICFSPQHVATKAVLTRQVICAAVRTCWRQSLRRFPERSTAVFRFIPYLKDWASVINAVAAVLTVALQVLSLVQGEVT